MEKHGIHMENEWENMAYIWRMSEKKTWNTYGEWVEKHEIHMENEWKNMKYIWRMSDCIVGMRRSSLLILYYSEAS